MLVGISQCGFLPLNFWFWRSPRFLESPLTGAGERAENSQKLTPNMTSSRKHPEAGYDFPPPPIEGSERLVPIRSWADMFFEMQVTSVEFDAFWYESVEEGVAYFFSWLGSPRSTILVVYDDDPSTHIECRTVGDILLPEAEAIPIITEVIHLFRSAGYWQDEAHH